jgi:hypothetical protein
MKIKVTAKPTKRKTTGSATKPAASRPARPAARAAKPAPGRVAKPATSLPPPTRMEIASRAYDLYAKSGHQPGREVEFWLEAERQLHREPKR